MSNQLFRELTSNKSVPLYQFCIERIFRGLKDNKDEVIIYDSDYLGVWNKNINKEEAACIEEMIKYNQE